MSVPYLLKIKSSEKNLTLRVKKTESKQKSKNYEAEKNVRKTEERGKTSSTFNYGQKKGREKFSAKLTVKIYTEKKHTKKNEVRNTEERGMASSTFNYGKKERENPSDKLILEISKTKSKRETTKKKQNQMSREQSVFGT